MRRLPLVLLIALLPASVSRAVECACLHPDLAKLPASGARLVLLPPRVEIVDAHGSVAEDPGEIARALVPEIHCRLEMLGFEVDAHSLREDVLAEDVTKRALAERAWKEFSRTSGLACIPDASVDPDSMTLSDAVFPLGAPLSADGIVLARARTVVRSKKLKAFLRTIQTVAPDARWPGPQTDVTWVEVCIADARTGRVLALYGVAEEGDVSRHPVRVASQAIDRALADLPSPGGAVPREPTRVIYESKSLAHWLKTTGSELTQRAAGTREGSGAPARPEDLAQARGMECAAVSGGARIVLSRRPGAAALLVVNEMQRPVRVSASQSPFIDLDPGDAVLLDVTGGAPWMVVTDADDAELARIDCIEAIASRVQARILPP